MTFVLRLATLEDCGPITALMDRAIVELQKGFLSTAEIEASFSGMGLDTQLIEDQTYYCVLAGSELAGCGGWSRRETLYGGNHTDGRNARRLDPKTEPARIRAMYTCPDFVRNGIGRMIIEASEHAAREEGFKSLTMAATLAGVPFYERAGYQIEAKWEDTSGAVPVPLVTMTKLLA